MALNQTGNHALAEEDLKFPDPANPDPIDPDITDPAVTDPEDVPGHDPEIDPDDESYVDKDIDPPPDADLPEPERPNRDISNRYASFWISCVSISQQLPTSEWAAS